MASRPLIRGEERERGALACLLAVMAARPSRGRVLPRYGDGETNDTTCGMREQGRRERDAFRPACRHEGRDEGEGDTGRGREREPLACFPYRLALPPAVCLSARPNGTASRGTDETMSRELTG